jgi:hypothetical protein
MYTAKYINNALCWVKTQKNNTSKKVVNMTPSIPASQCMLYEVRCGQDGNMYRVEFVSDDVSWVLFETKPSKSKIKSISFTDDELNNGCNSDFIRRPKKTEEKNLPHKKKVSKK